MKPKKTEKLRSLMIETKKGFSIMEVMLSIFLLSVGMIAIITLMANSIKNNANNRNSIIATQLAQEGIELVRNKRDLNIAMLSYEEAKDPAKIKNAAFKEIDKNKSYCPGVRDGKVELTGGCDGEVQYDDSSGYNHYSGETTIFSRKVFVLNSMGNDTRVVRSMAIWGNDGFPTDMEDCTIANKCVHVELTLTNTGWR